MKGVIGAKVIKEQWGSYVIRIQCTDKDSAEKVVRKLRMVGIFCSYKGED